MIKLALFFSCVLIWPSVALGQYQNCSYVTYQQTSQSLTGCQSRQNPSTAFTDSWSFTYQCAGSEGAAIVGPYGSSANLTATANGACAYNTQCTPSESATIGYASSAPDDSNWLQVNTEDYNADGNGLGATCEWGNAHQFTGYCASENCIDSCTLRWPKEVPRRKENQGE